MEGRKDATVPYPFKFKEEGPGLIAVIDALRMGPDCPSNRLSPWQHYACML